MLKKYFFLFLMLTACFLAGAEPARADIPAIERAALIALYNSTNGASWTNKTNWLGPAGTENTWYGVETNGGNTAVIGLDLWDNNLSGTLPAELGNLSSLDYLWLYYNNLSGTLPAELGNLTQLTDMDLYANQFSGAIPAALGNLTSLQVLYLSGERDLDQGVCIGNSQFSGAIPAELGNLAALTTLDLSCNQLGGTIPPELGDLTALEYLYLDHNHLKGSIPSTLLNLVNLTPYDQYPDDYDNDICGNHLFTSDADLRDFLNARHKDGDWRSCQIPIVMPWLHLLLGD